MFGVAPSFLIMDQRDGWCFDGEIFRMCDEGCKFNGKSPAGSSRYLQIQEVRMERRLGWSAELQIAAHCRTQITNNRLPQGSDPGSCLIVNKRSGQLGTDSCLTGKGNMNENTVFTYSSGVLSVLNKKRERMCVKRRENHSARVGKCEDVGYTPIKIGGVVSGGGDTG